jgi:site-specific recombinase XerC
MAGASASTVNLVLVACRQVARISVARGEMPPEEEARLSLVKRVQASRLPRGRMLSAEERDLLFESCAREGGALARRDACVLALGLGAGLRREEIASVSSSAVDQRALVLRFIGKGDREACVPLKAELRRAVGDWLRRRVPL